MPLSSSQKQEKKKDIKQTWREKEMNSLHMFNRKDYHRFHREGMLTAHNVLNTMVVVTRSSSSCSIHTSSLLIPAD